MGQILTEDMQFEHMPCLQGWISCSAFSGCLAKHMRQVNFSVLFASLKAFQVSVAALSFDWFSSCKNLCMMQSYSSVVVTSSSFCNSLSCFCKLQISISGSMRIQFARCAARRAARPAKFAATIFSLFCCLKAIAAERPPPRPDIVLCFPLPSSLLVQQFFSVYFFFGHVTIFIFFLLTLGNCTISEKSNRRELEGSLQLKGRRDVEHGLVHCNAADQHARIDVDFGAARNENARICVG